MNRIKDRVTSRMRATSDEETRLLFRDILNLLEDLDKPYSIEWVKDKYRLSPTEYRVLCMLVEGKTPATIAEETGTQVSTVRVHISRIYRRTNVNSYNELTSLLLQKARNT